jgi:hypothetical protein
LRKAREATPEGQAAKAAKEAAAKVAEQVQSQQIEKMRYEAPTDSGGKFWEGWVYPTRRTFDTVYDVAVRFGPIGSEGQVRRVASDMTLPEALKVLNQRRYNKEKKGYRRVAHAHGGAE